MNQATLRTSQQWWDVVNASPEKTINWLKDQYHGELTAADRMEKYIISFVGPGQENIESVIRKIIDQERTHASWVGELLANRGVTPQELNKVERYWDEVLPAIDEYGTLEYASAVAAHAEAMRLERIQVIANDPNSPEDIRAVFAKIAPEEEFHTRAFASFAGDAAMSDALKQHAKGLEALGLIL